MRTFPFYTNQDASVDSTSPIYCPDCGQDMRWMIQIVLDGLDGTPCLIVEETLDESIWTPIASFDGIELNESPCSIKDSYFMGKCMRLRIEANDNTTGTVTALLGVKTKSN